MKVGDKIEHTGKKLTQQQSDLGVAAEKEKAALGNNPPSWVDDEESWEKAKEAASKTYDEDDDAYWPVVTHIYQNITKASDSDIRARMIRAAGGNEEGHPFWGNQFTEGEQLASPVEVSMKTTKPFIGKVIGPHPAYGEELAFGETRRISSAYHKGTITHSGVYKVPEGSQVGSRGGISKFVRVTKEGQVTEPSKEEVHRYLSMKTGKVSSSGVLTRLNAVGSADNANVSIVRADDPGEVDVDDVRIGVSRLAQEDDRLQGDDDVATALSPFVSSLGLTPDGEWRARIQVGGDTFEVDVEMDEDGMPTAIDNPRKVQRKTTWVPAKGATVWNYVKAAGGNEPGHPFWGNQHTSGEVGAEPKQEHGFDDIGSGRYDNIGMHQRLGIHADKAEEFEKKGDKFNASSHARAAIRMAASTGQLGSREHIRSEKVLKRVEGFHIYPNHVKTGEPSSNNAVRCRDCGVPIVKAGQWKQGESCRFMWMPSGVNTITATVTLSDGTEKPIRFAVNCDERTAARVQKNFEAVLAENPNRPPFGCVEHKEMERSVRPQKFEYLTAEQAPQPGVFMTGLPTALGEKNVNGDIHSSWSPSFDTDADYAALVKGSDGVWEFRDGARGSQSNPAEVLSASPKSVGSLTNWNAFRTILPVTVTAREPSVKTMNIINAINAVERETALLDGVPNETVRAGDYPGHEFHGNQYVGSEGGGGDHSESSKESGKAHEASGKASDKASHRHAASAHEHAAAKWEKTAEESTDANEQAHAERVAKYHHSMSDYHSKASAKYGRGKAKASEPKTATPSSVFATLKATAPKQPEAVAASWPPTLGDIFARLSGQAQPAA